MLTRCLLVALCIALMGLALSTATAQEVIAVDIQAAPHVLALRSAGVWVTIHTDIAFSQVDRPTCAVEVDGEGVPVAWTKADSLGNLVVKLRQSEVKALFADLESPVRASVVLTGLTNDGDSFEGSDTIRVRP